MPTRRLRAVTRLFVQRRRRRLLGSSTEAGRRAMTTRTVAASRGAGRAARRAVKWCAKRGMGSIIAPRTVGGIAAGRGAAAPARVTAATARPAPVTPATVALTAAVHLPAAPGAKGGGGGAAAATGETDGIVVTSGRIPIATVRGQATSHASTHKGISVATARSRRHQHARGTPTGAGHAADLRGSLRTDMRPAADRRPGRIACHALAHMVDL